MEIRLDLKGNFRFQSDATFIRVILYELIANEFIFRDYLKVGLINVEAQLQEEMLIICITDRGDGISSQIQNEIFSMFYRGSSKSTGNGLGLYKVLKCVKALGGTINLHSETETQFVIRIPITH